VRRYFKWLLYSKVCGEGNSVIFINRKILPGPADARPNKQKYMGPIWVPMWAPHGLPIWPHLGFATGINIRVPYGPHVYYTWICFTFLATTRDFSEIQRSVLLIMIICEKLLLFLFILFLEIKIHHGSLHTLYYRQMFNVLLKLKCS